MLTFFSTAICYAQPPEAPNLPPEHDTRGLLDLQIPNLEGNLIELENLTDCDIDYYAYVTIITDQTFSVKTYVVETTVGAGGSINVDWSALTNQINNDFSGQNFAITHWSYNIKIGGTWILPLYPGEDKTVSTSLPPPCDCLRLQFLLNNNPRKLKISPGTGC
jgi:hypothetical protein